MKTTLKKFVNFPVVFAKNLVNRNSHPQQRITLFTIGMELEKDWTKMRSRFAKGITKVSGIKAKLPFIKNRKNGENSTEQTSITQDDIRLILESISPTEAVFKSSIAEKIKDMDDDDYDPFFEWSEVQLKLPKTAKKNS
jgi:hypothetical protein